MGDKMTNDPRNSGRAQRWSLGLLATTMLTAVGAPALAQQAAAVGLEEVVVTAQKRSENLQDVPMSIQAMGTEKLEQLQVSDVTDYAKFLPSVTIRRAAPGFTTVDMRGVPSGRRSHHS